MSTADQAVERGRLFRFATWLIAGTLVYNIIEGVVAVWSGAVAESNVLLAFGLDSGIECVAAGVMLWRLSASRDDERREVIAQRVIGASFLALAGYVVFHAVQTVLAHDAPTTSAVGMVLGCLSLLIMPGLAWGKLRIAAKLESKALRAEALETLACSYLTVTLLIGLGLNALFGWWWADPVAAALMVPWLVREGMECVSAANGCSRQAACQRGA